MYIYIFTTKSSVLGVFEIIIEISVTKLVEKTEIINYQKKKGKNLLHVELIQESIQTSVQSLNYSSY